MFKEFSVLLLGLRRRSLRVTGPLLPGDNFLQLGVRNDQIRGDDAAHLFGQHVPRVLLERPLDRQDTTLLFVELVERRAPGCRLDPAHLQAVLHYCDVHLGLDVRLGRGVIEVTHEPVTVVETQDRRRTILDFNHLSFQHRNLPQSNMELARVLDLYYNEDSSACKLKIPLYKQANFG